MLKKELTVLIPKSAPNLKADEIAKNVQKGSKVKSRVEEDGSGITFNGSEEAVTKAKKVIQDRYPQVKLIVA
jgi:hypothetical protein